MSSPYIYILLYQNFLLLMDIKIDSLVPNLNDMGKSLAGFDIE